MHAGGDGLKVVVTAPDIGEKQERVLVDPPVTAQLVVEGSGQRNNPVLMAFAMADDELVLPAKDVVDGEAEALAEPEAAAIDELEWGAVTAQADVPEELTDLLAGEDGRKGVVIPGANSGEEGPIVVVEKIDEEEASGGDGLAEGLGLPVLLKFYEEDIVAQLGFGEGGGITGEVGLEKAHLAVIGVPGAIGVVAEREEIRELSHGRIGMLVIDWIDKLARRGAILCRRG